jgi:hypothetical protein
MNFSNLKTSVCQRTLQVGCLWFTPVIPATQKAEIRRTTVGGQPGQKTRPYLKNTQHKKGLGV